MAGMERLALSGFVLAVVIGTLWLIGSVVGDVVHQLLAPLAGLQ